MISITEDQLVDAILICSYYGLGCKKELGSMKEKLGKSVKEKWVPTTDGVMFVWF